MNNCTKLKIVLLVMCFTITRHGICQKSELYPPFTKWYQDPLGLRPLRLSTAFGFVWGSAAVAASILFTKKDSCCRTRLSVYTEQGYSFGYKFPYTGVLHNEFGIMYDVRKWMAIGTGIDILHFKDKINNTWAAGITPFARWYPRNTDKIRFYFQYGAGMSYSLRRFPLTGTGWESDTARTGTKFNVVSKYGVGSEMRLSRKLWLQITGRHFHLSNGNIKGIQRNPSHDSNGFFAGIIYQMRK